MTVHSRTSTYNKIGQTTNETDAMLKYDGKTYTGTSTYTYVDGGGSYLLGSVYQINASKAVTGASTKSTRTTNGYDWYDGAVQYVIQYDLEPDLQHHLHQRRLRPVAIGLDLRRAASHGEL